jgi:hypothetical protein
MYSSAYLHAIAHGIDEIFLVGALCGAAAFLAAMFIREIPLRAQPSPREHAGSESASATA